eukprot:TRINITY_DN3258_c2_g5_i1.p1 TRINITY_DN3258_c2_g5~~TRINITY_DN3258_c2_g5_i1.p1  ORF type:complete len:218 (+),score=36.81 TRINITY_DN3258_c2_g5_i1:56-655(+)
MNSFNHFFTAFNLLFFLEYIILHQYKQRKIQYIVYYSVTFAVCIDFDMIIGYFSGKSSDHLRTWFQEPLSLFLVAPFLAFICNKYTKKKYYTYYVYICYTSHILLDYLTAHIVCPFAPFKLEMWSTVHHTAIFHAFPSTFEWKNYGISELWWLLINFIVFLLFLTNWKKTVKIMNESKLMNLNIQNEIFKPPDVDFEIE